MRRELVETAHTGHTDIECLFPSVQEDLWVLCPTLSHAETSCGVLLQVARSGQAPPGNSAADTILSRGHSTWLSPASHLCKSQLCHRRTGHMLLLPASEIVTIPSRGCHSGRGNGCASGMAHVPYTAAPFQQQTDSSGLQPLKLILLPSDSAKVPA